MRNKPIFLWPSIVVYKLFHLFFSGIFFSLYLLINLLLFISYMWWKLVKIPFLPFLWFKNTFLISETEKLKIKEEKDKNKYEKEMKILKEKGKIKLQKEQEKLAKINEKRKKEEEEKLKLELENEVKEQQRLLKLSGTVNLNDKILTDKKPDNIDINNKKTKTKAEIKKEAKKKLKEEAKQRKIDLKNEKKKLKDNSVYVNENADLQKKSFGDKINDSLEKLINGPKEFLKKQKNKITNNALVRNKKNEDLMQREALLINFDGDDAKKSDKKIVFEYVGKNAEGKLIKSYFEAFSKVEVHSFLLSEGFEVYSIKTNSIIQLLHASSKGNAGKIKNKDLIFFLAQLSTYIKAGIPLVEALRILSRQFKNKNYEKIFRSLIYDLTMGDNLSDAMSKRGNAFPRILVNMVKASEMTGDLPETLDDMGGYFEEMEKTKKQMITALTYPTLIFVLAIAAITFIMIYIVPQFVTIYEDMDNATLPWITVAVLEVSDFLKTYLILLLLGIFGGLIGFIWCYKNIKMFRTLCQWFTMKVPIIGDVIIYNEVTMFTKTFASLLKHNVFITDSMDILNKITGNEIWKMIILDTITNLAKGDKISLAFQDHWAVPLPAYEMIVTGERTGQLPEMMQKVSDYYQELHKNQVGRIKAFVEPILIIFLTGAVGLIVMSIIIPMFGMYSNLS